VRAKITTLLFTVLLLTAAGAAAGETLHPDQATETNQRFGQLTLENKSAGLLSSTSDTLFGGTTGLLSFLGVKDIYNPGDTAAFDLEIEEVRQNTDDGAVLIEVYDCADAGCNNPPSIDEDGDGTIDSCRKVGDVRSDSDDCVDIVMKDASISYAPIGYTTNFDYTIPSDADGKWIMVGYFWDFETSEAISEVSKEDFTVETSGSGGIDDGSGDSGNDDGSDDTSSEPGVVAYRQPDVSVSVTESENRRTN